MEIIKNKYNILCNTKNDINEHLPTLYQYATDCESIIELGIRGCTSSWALVYGLMNNNKSNKKLLMNDIAECDIGELLNNTNDLPINIKYDWINDLELKVEEMYDMTFIDTWHIYGQLKRELEKYSKVTNKYIIMHDTDVDGKYGSVIRMGQNIEDVVKNSGFSKEEICNGLTRAIKEFLNNNNDWKVEKHFTNNNGLTILKKIN